jgi:hypothetical protein
LPAAKAALVAVTQTTSNSAAMISIISLMTQNPPQKVAIEADYSIEIAARCLSESARSLHKS